MVTMEPDHDFNKKLVIGLKLQLNLHHIFNLKNCEKMN